MKEKESDIQNAIIKWLEWNRFLVIKINNVGILKANGQYIPPRQRGISDIIALKDGKFYAIECKRPGQKPTIYQEDFIKQVQQHGGIGFVATSIDDVKKSIQ